MQQALAIGAGLFAIGLAGFLFSASAQPKEFHLERSILTQASCQEVYAVISDLGRFREWSPWQKLDPSMTTEMSGEQGHVGATYSWTGNSKVGAGRMTITEAVTNSHIRLHLEFFRPFAATNTSQWSVRDEGDQRRITWTMDGSNDKLFQRAFAMVVNMDKMVGKDFEAGLASLKAVVETKAS